VTPEPVAQPPLEPIVVTFPAWEGKPERTIVVGPEDELAWQIAYAWRETEVALKNAEKELRIKRAQITKLQRDHDEKRRTYSGRRHIEYAFEKWQELSRHARSILTADRFDPARARLDEGYTPEQLAWAAAGIATNPHVVEGAKHDEFELAVRSGRNLERYANRCAPAYRQQITADLKNTDQLTMEAE